MKCAISVSGGLGEMIMLLPIFQKFKGKLILSSHYKELFSLYDFDIIWWNEKESDAKNIIRITKELWKINPEIVYGTYPNGRRINLLLFLSPGRKIFCDDGNYNLKRFISILKLTPKSYPIKIPFHKKKSYIERNSQILAINPNIPFDFREKEEFREESERFSEKGPFAVIHPTSKYKIKRWDIQKFISVSKKILKEGIRIVFVLGREDGEEFEYLKSYFSKDTEGDEVKIIFGSDINRVISFTKRCFFFLGNDSAVAHIAGISGRKTFVIYGFTRHYHTAPPNSEVISLFLPCSPCYNFAKGELAVARECKIGIACLKNITEEMVWSRVKNFISGANQRP
ncbi:hypothetical protein HRbin19_00539 [bacterium HR19]|nr:hypothetical protein HRbin19_00539 [bacterium HR19]